MKKLVILIFGCAVALAACSKNKKDNFNETYANTGYKAAVQADASNVGGNPKYRILDQEFDNMLAPETDYDALPAYELQACGDSYLPPVDATAVAAAKAGKRTKASGKAASTKTTRAKQVKNTTNIYYVDGPNPDIPVSSTTTTKTVYKSGEVSSSTTSSSNTKTTTNPDGSVTTTTVSY